MTFVMNEYTYEKLKKFQRVKSLKEFLISPINYQFFEDETILQIKENINKYKKVEQIRLRKIELLTVLLDKIEDKIVHKKLKEINRY
jgi:transcriptional regulator